MQRTVVFDSFEVMKKSGHGNVVRVSMAGFGTFDNPQRLKEHWVRQHV